MPRPKKQKLKRRKDGRYCCRYHGMQFMGNSEDEALEAREAYKRAEAVGAVIRSAQMTVSEYADYWLSVHKKSVKASTFNGYTSILSNAITPIADRQLDTLNSDDIAETYAALTGKSASYIHKAQNLIRAMLDSATDAQYIYKNPARASSVTVPKGKRGTHRAISKAERNLIDHTPHRMQIAALIMLYCGLRRGELLGLQAQDIQGETLTVSRAVYYVSNQPMLSDTKTEHSRRAVPAPDFILAKLPKMRRDCFILTGTRKPMTEQVFTRAWANYNKALGISVRCHDLRASYATWLRDLGVEMHQAILWMGHADEKMILHIYDHPGEERETAAKNLLKTAFRMQNDMQPTPEVPKSVAK